MKTEFILNFAGPVAHVEYRPILVNRFGYTVLLRFEDSRLNPPNSAGWIIGELNGPFYAMPFDAMLQMGKQFYTFVTGLSNLGDNREELDKVLSEREQLKETIFHQQVEIAHLTASVAKAEAYQTDERLRDTLQQISELAESALNGD